jgi:ATP-dependent RNA helicase DeaD
VTKAEIGTIRIFDRETKFEIAEASAAKFVAAILANNNAEIRIEPAGADRPSRVGEKKPGRFPERFPKKKPHATPAQIRDDLQPLKKKTKKPKRAE